MAELENVRKVLDYAPPKQMPKGVYYDALNRRLNREVAARKTLFAPSADEALLVVPPEEWDAAIAARKRAEEQGTELEAVRGDYSRLQDNHTRLEAQLAELQRRLDEIKGKKPLQLIGVRKRARELRAEPPAVETAPEPAPEPEPIEVAVIEAPPEPIIEVGPSTEQVLQSQGWDVLHDGADSGAPSTLAGFEVVAEGEGDAAQAGFEPVSEEELAAETGAASLEETSESETGSFGSEVNLQRMQDQIERTERELEKVEGDLVRLESRERELSPEASGPYVFKGYTLYRRTTGFGAKQKTLYFFARATPDEGEPAMRPRGYVAVLNPVSGLPYLKHAVTPPAKAAKPKAARKARAKPAKRTRAKSSR